MAVLLAVAFAACLVSFAVGAALMWRERNKYAALQAAIEARLAAIKADVQAEVQDIEKKV